MIFDFFKKNETLLKTLSLFFIFLALALYIKNNLGVFKKIFEISFTDFFILSLLFFIEMIINSYFFKLLFNYFKIDIKFFESLKLTFLNNYAKYIIPKSGNVARGIYLKKYHSLSYKNYAIALGLLNLILILSVSLCSIVSLVWCFLKNNYLNLYLFGFFLFLNICSLLMLLLNKKIIKFIAKKRWNEDMEQFLNKIKKRNIITLIIVRIAATISSSLSFYFAYFLLFKKISLSASITIVSSGLLSPYISITPASLGIKETIMSFVAKLTQLDFTSTMATSSLNRSITIIWTLFFGILITHFFIKKINSKNNN